MLRIFGGFSGFRGSSLAGLLICGFLVLSGASCSDEDDPVVGTGTGGTGNRGGLGGTGAAGTGGDTGGSNGGTGGTSGGGGEGGEAPIDPRTPVVTIVSPEALDDPADGPVLVGDDVTVVCRAERSSASGSEEVNPESVVLEMFDEDGDRVGQEQRGVPNGNDDEYVTTFPISGLPNGVVTFRCTAEDVGTPLTGTGEASTFFDGGPAINIVSPQPDAVYPQMGVARFEIQVDEEPLTDGDDEAAVESVMLEVADVVIPLDEEDPGIFVANVDFADDDVFGAALEGSVPLVVRATNGRSDPGPVTRSVGYPFVVDGEGPIITIESPENQTVHGGRVELKFTVTDELAGVSANSVVVTVNDEDHHYRVNPVAWTGTMGDDFVFTFDSRTIQGSRAQATITISATDSAQNAARVASLILYLDNQPPIVDMDPPTIRERRGTGSNIRCSYPFDPLGMSPGDVTDCVEGLPFLRTLVWDQTNRVAGLPITYMAGTDQDTVYVYLQSDPTEPVIVDTDADDVCDGINPSLLDPMDPRGLQLKAVPQAGTAWYTAVDTESPTVPTGYCGFQDGVTEPPNDLCTNQLSDMPRVTQHGIVASEPVVYGVGSLPPAECTGGSWEIQQFVAQEGWICLAASASDNVGNKAVSRPLRLCYDNTETPFEPSCKGTLANPPSCTDGCTLPKSFVDRDLGTGEEIRIVTIE